MALALISFFFIRKYNYKERKNSFKFILRYQDIKINIFSNISCPKFGLH